MSMLSLLNRYAHGYVAVPIIQACIKQGVFSELNSEQFVEFDELVGRCHANPGFFKVAITLLESMGWLQKQQSGYTLTQLGANYENVPSDIHELLSFPFTEFLINDNETASLEYWLIESRQGWHCHDEILRDFFDGLLLTPLLLSLKETHFTENAQAGVRAPVEILSNQARQHLIPLLVERQWLQESDGAYFFSAAGSYLIERIFINATVVSYRPMLVNIDQVLFGDPSTVFYRDEDGHEMHVDRTLNVIGSGFQHQKYFADLEATVVALFNRQPLSEQPRYVADMGCGDGSMLKKIYQIVAAKTARGEALDQYPLTLLGVDYNDKALEATAETLVGLDHMTIQGDIGDPQQLLQDLHDLGIDDTDSILHVRSFLDHDRPYKPPQDDAQQQRRADVDYQAVYVASDGAEIPAEDVVQSLVEHLQRWAGVLGKHGLLLLEVHCLPPQTVNAHLSNSENLHFDAYHRFSQQLLVEADHFVMCAAEAGLFPTFEGLKKYPRTLPYCRITLNRFERRPYQVRYAQRRDMSALLQLEQQCWGDMAVTEAVIQQRLQRFAAGQLVLEMDGQVVAVAYCQRIASLELLQHSDVQSMESLHTDGGDWLQLLGVNVLPSMQHARLGDQLLEFVLQRAALISGVRGVCGVTRFKDFARHPELTAQQYLTLKNDRDWFVDSNLRFHQLHGAEMLALMPHYRLSDTDNQGFGVLLKYDLLRRQRLDQEPQPQTPSLPQPDVDDAAPQVAAEVELAARRQSIYEQVQQSLRLVVGERLPVKIDAQQPLMELGLDSVDLLELSEQIAQQFHLTLDSTYFFVHNTLNKVVDHLLSDGQLDDPTSVAEATPELVGVATDPLAEQLLPFAEPIKVDPLQQTQLEQQLQQSIALIKAIDAEAIAVDVPLMEQGLDSVDLLELSEWLQSDYQLQLDTSFFFEYPTLAKIAAQLLRLGKVSTVVSEAPTSPLESPLPTSDEVAASDIAIVGIACRLPGSVDNLDDLWQLLQTGDSAISTLPTGRFQWPADIDPASEHQGIDRGGFIDDIDAFDAEFFRISPQEATLLDPQQRLLMELSWHCLEDAGIAPMSLAGSRTGVYVGASGSDYKTLLEQRLPRIEAHFGIGTYLTALPNRLSYFYDWCGPSLQLDTACSSSLVALHEARQALLRQDCEQALVAGINLICHSSDSIAFQRAGMLAADGRCKTFDVSANGYVRGEGAVALLLKPLANASANSDRIYAVLKGSAVNHGGLASSFTAPNPAQQSQLLQQVYQQAGIDPASLGYIEAHGTGTSLGDPIEVRGLVDAFAQVSQVPAAQRRCAIGSLKSNLGHLEAAAGLAGLLKVVVSLRQQRLPATINFTELNPHINLADSGLYVADREQPWPTEASGILRAGVSSFGSGGSNAHVIVQQPPLRLETSADDAKTPRLLVLSAPTAEALQRQQQALASWLQHPAEAVSLASLSYTLLRGREHFDCRWACACHSMDQLQAALATDLQRSADRSTRQGQVKAQSGDCDALLQAYGHAGREDQQVLLEQLADAYCAGYAIAAEGLFPQPPTLISAPGYVFAKTRFWIEASQAAGQPTCQPTSAMAETTAASTIHPLLQRNQSTLRGLAFTSEFSGDEFFFADHQVQGQRLLPAVAYLEMVRAALQQVADEPDAYVIENVLWQRPIVAAHRQLPVSVSLQLQAQPQFETTADSADCDIAFQIHLHNGEAAELCCEGVARRGRLNQTQRPALDVSRLAREGAQVADYQVLAAQGFDYGASHRAVQQLWWQPQGCVARLQLPQGLSAEQIQAYQWHPSLLDGALQVALFYLQQAADSTSQGQDLSWVPFALTGFEVHRPLSRSLWVQITNPVASGAGYCLDVQLYDDNGHSCGLFQGLVLRQRQSHSVAEPVRNVPPESDVAALGNRMFVPSWQPCPVTQKAHSLPACCLVGLDPAQVADQFAQLQPHCDGLSLLTASATMSVPQIASLLQAQPAFDQLIFLAPPPLGAGVSIGESTSELSDPAATLLLFKLIQALLSLGYGQRSLSWLLVTQQALANDLQLAVDASHSPLHGLLGSVGQEYPHWQVSRIDVAAGSNSSEIWSTLPDLQNHSALLWHQRQWWHQRLLPQAGMPQAGTPQAGTPHAGTPQAGMPHTGEERPSSAPTQSLYRRGGVYVVIGGAGGIGQVFSDYLIRHYQAQLVWLGRRPQDETISAACQRLAQWGPEPLYIQADASDGEQMQRAQQLCLQRFGQIHGLVNSAIDLADASVARMSESEFLRGLQAKQASALNMQVFADQPLDFVLFFSSIMSYLTAPGQSNYAAGCLFQDTFAQQWQQRGNTAQTRVRVVNWGYWGDVGVAASDHYRAHFAQLGFDPIEHNFAMLALEQLLAGDAAQLAVMNINQPQPLPQMAGSVSATGQAKVAVSIDGSDQTDPSPTEPVRADNIQADIVREYSAQAELADATRNFLKQLVSQTTKLPVARIEASAALEKYGIDSILVVQLSKALGDVVEVSPTLFFECQTIDELTDSLCQQQAERLSQHFGLDSSASPVASPVEAPVAAAQTVVEGASVVKEAAVEEPAAGTPAAGTPAENIAIVGLSGRYPQADNIEAFWHNLQSGRNCIGEVPDQRWDWRHNYTDERGLHDHCYTRWGGFIDGIDQFDPRFFQISPREAAKMDPQERLFIQEAYRAVEDAGYTPQTLANEQQVGVFVGVMNGRYPSAACFWSIANRTSYLMDFQGPSLAVDTACSSSLTAIHLAIDSIRNDSCEVALAGGVNLVVERDHFVNLCELTMVSPSDQCKAFGAGADGFIDAEGVGCIVLKPLTAAERSGDHIYGVICGSSINAGGKTNGYFVPNPKAQANLIGKALARSGVDARHISYVEAHGTGTSLGDPIEIAGLSRAFASATDDCGFCAIGSVKSNIGHTESAAGIAGLTKILLQMQHQQLVPSLHSAEPNEHIDFARTPFQVQQQLSEWSQPSIEVDGQRQTLPRIAAISSFGAGGANAHLIVQEPQPLAALPERIDHWRQQTVAPVLMVLSARTEQALQARAQQLLDGLRADRWQAEQLRDIAYTLQVGRLPMKQRLALIGNSIEQLQLQLEAFVERGECLAEVQRGEQESGSDLLALFDDDSDLQQALLAWIGKGKLDKLMALWVRGAEIDWSLLYRHQSQPRRISLPTYPFAKEGYWLSPERKPMLQGMAPEVAASATEPSANVSAPVKSEKALSAATQPTPSRSALAGPQADAMPVAPTSVTEMGQKPQGRLPQERLPLVSLAQVSSRFDPAVGVEPLRLSSLDAVPVTALLGESNGDRQQTTTEVIGLPPEQTNQQTPLHSNRLSAEDLVDRLSRSLAQALYIELDNIDVDEQFVELGLDSIIGVEWVRQINRELGLTMPATKVYDYPTVTLLANYLANYLTNHLVNELETQTSSTAAAPNSTGALPVNSDAVGRTPSSGEPSNLSAIAAFLSQSLADALFLEVADLDLNEPFIELGLDSIVGVEWVRAINKYFANHQDYAAAWQDQPLAATKVYDYPTLQQLSAYVASRLSGLPSVPIADVPAAPSDSPLSCDDDEADLFFTDACDVDPDFVARPDGITSAHSAPAQLAPSHKPVDRERLVAELSQSLADALYAPLADIDADEPFVELGLDSIIGVEWSRQINRQYGLDLAATKLYDYPSIRQLAGFLQTQISAGAGGTRVETPVESQTDTLAAATSLDQLLQQIESGQLQPEQAEQIFQQQEAALLAAD